jgi:hypothetical protein
MQAPSLDPVFPTAGSHVRSHVRNAFRNEGSKAFTLETRGTHNSNEISQRSQELLRNAAKKRQVTQNRSGLGALA